jgi:DHA1 family multidrug resistance protein-like MFS transporter
MHPVIGALIVIPPFFCYLYFIQEPQFDDQGNIKPEKRLVPCFVGAFCVPM